MLNLFTNCRRKDWWRCK